MEIRDLAAGDTTIDARALAPEGGARSSLSAAPGDKPHEDSAKRRQILDGARAAFLAMGFDGASMNDVARLAGVSKGTLYVYFTNKEALFETLIREERRQQAEQLFVLDDESHDVRAVLTKLGISLVSMMVMPNSVAQIRTVIGVVNKFPQIGRAFFEAGPQYGMARLSNWMEKQVDAGYLTIEDPSHAAMQFIDLCQAGVLKPILFGWAETASPEAVERSVTSAVKVFMAAYGPKG